MIMSNMPNLPVDTMLRAACISNDFDARVIRAAFKVRKGSAVSTLRASKPFPTVYADGSEESLFKACANYVWRMVSFSFVGYGKLACIPVTADFDIASFYYKKHGISFHADCTEEARQAYYADKKACIGRMDSLIKQFESTVPVELQAGVMRWGRALGYIQ
jgi:hypothetical protein